MYKINKIKENLYLTKMFKGSQVIGKYQLD